MTLLDMNKDTITEEEKKPPPAAEHIGHLDIRVGQITECSNSQLDPLLYEEVIDVGQEQPRYAVSELVRYYKPEELIGRKVAILLNATTIHTRGIAQGRSMLLCGYDKENRIEVLDAPQTSQPGDIVGAIGYPVQPLPVHNNPVQVFLQTEEEPFQVVRADMTIDSSGCALYKDAPLKIIGKENMDPITARTFRDCEIIFD